jgi:hypothetical protein
MCLPIGYALRRVAPFLRHQQRGGFNGELTLPANAGGFHWGEQVVGQLVALSCVGLVVLGVLAPGLSLSQGSLMFGMLWLPL